MSEPSSHSPLPGPTAAVPCPEQPQAQSSAPVSALLLYFRPLWSLLVGTSCLGASLGLGWLGGVLLAQGWPSANPTMPAQERVMRQVSRNLIKLRQLPQWWQDQEPLPIPGEPAGQLGVPGAVSLAASPPLNQEVENLQQAFGNWQTRLVALEKQFHLPAVGTLEQRLAQLQQRVRENPEISRVASPPALPPTPGEVTPGLQPYREPEFSAIGDRIVLPGQLLFEPGSSILTTTGQQLLATIQPDLRRYGAVTVLVASHTAGSDRPEQLRQLSFAQALAVRTYLAQQLPQNQFRWLVAGFGASRPLVVNQADSQNRNQRIEIGIVRSMVQ